MPGGPLTLMGQVEEECLTKGKEKSQSGGGKLECVVS